MSRNPKEGEQFLLRFPSKYLRGVDFGAKPNEEKEVRVTIARVEVDANVDVFDGASHKTEQKILLHFEGKKLPLILNKTNGKLLSQCLGTMAMDEWVGQEITLYTKWAKWFGVHQPGVRIRTDKKRKG